MKQELLKGLTEEQIAQVNACNNIEEVLAVAKESGIELTDEQLEAVSGGDCFDTPVDVCPRCGHTGTIHGYRTDHTYGYSCSYCGFPLPKKKDVKQTKRYEIGFSPGAKQQTNKTVLNCGRFWYKKAGGIQAHLLSTNLTICQAS